MAIDVSIGRVGVWTGALDRALIKLRVDRSDLGN